MSSLKSLELNSVLHITNIHSQGRQTLFTALQLANLDLVKLDLSNNSMNDEDLQLLVRLVSGMSSLKLLNLNQSGSVTPTGWLALTGYLQSPNFALKELELNENNIDDGNMVAFTNALVNNKTLKRLYLDGTYDEDDDEYISLITEKGWEAVSTLLCNKTSILDSYNSNHTLQGLSEDDKHDHLPDYLESYLKLNGNKDKVEVARQKILQSHFSSEDDTATNIQELLDMELEMIPAALSWIGRSTQADWKGTKMSGLSTMFNLMRRVPDLFDSNAQKKKPPAAKRKRGDGLPGKRLI